MNGIPLDSFENSVLLSILGECALALENIKNAKEKEEAAVLAQNEQLRANLLRAISHDLRTPLTAISGSADNLLANYKKMDDALREQTFTDIYDDSMWLINLVENLLAVARIEGGQVNLTRNIELMDEVVSEALKHINRKSKEHTIRVTSGKDFILAHIDAKLIVQVIINLVDNAIKYTPVGSVIEIHTDQKEQWVTVSVSDNGPGIPDEQKPRIFDMFYSGANKVVDSRRSLGLGLSLCKSILNINAVSVVPTVDYFGIAAGLEGFIHELAVILNRNPDGAQIHLNIGRGQRLRLNRLQCLHIPGEQFRLLRRLLTCVKQLVPHMAAQIFLRQLPALIRVPIVFLRIEIDAVAQLCHQLARFFPGQEGHIGEVYPQLAVQADMQGVLGGVGVIDLTEWPDGRLMEDGRLVPAAFVLALVLNGAQQGELIVIGKGEDIALAVDGSILGGKAVIDLIELILCFAEVQRVILMGLDHDNLTHGFSTSCFQWIYAVSAHKKTWTKLALRYWSSDFSPSIAVSSV